MALDIVLTLFLVLLNGFFVAAEFAIVKVRASQLEVKAQAGNATAKLATGIVGKLDGYLAATQLGITLASLGLGWIGEEVVSEIILGIMAAFGVQMQPETAKNIALPVAFAIITVLHIVFGELAPKSIAIQRPERTTLVVSYPLRFFYVLFRPFIWVLNGIANVLLKALGIRAVHGADVHSSEELKHIVRQGKESGAIESSDYDIINNALHFSERTARQIMIPRTEVFAIDVRQYGEATLEKIMVEGFSRIPCFEEAFDNMVGLVNIKDLLLKVKNKEAIDLRQIMRPILVIPETKKIGPLLKEFQVKHQQMAVVVNEYGNAIGIITMEDILEELVGEIQDEYDNEVPVIEKSGEKLYSALGTAPLEELNELLPHPLEKDENYETIAGMLIMKMDRIPNVNEKIVLDNYEITVVKKRGNTLQLVQLRDLAE